MRGTPLIAPLRQPGTKTKMNGFVEISTLLIHSAPKQNLMSGMHLSPFLYPYARGVASGMQNPLANFIGVFLLVRDVSGLRR